MGAQMQRGAYSRSAGPRRRNARLRWAMRGQDPLKEQRVPGSAGLLGDRTHSESNGFPVARPGARRQDHAAAGDRTRAADALSLFVEAIVLDLGEQRLVADLQDLGRLGFVAAGLAQDLFDHPGLHGPGGCTAGRSEERRVGKERSGWRSWWR